MDYSVWPNLTAMFFDQAARHADQPFLWAKRDGRYEPLSWRAVAEQVRTLAAGLEALGLARGDRVVLVSENRPEWLIADLAIMVVGGITVPAYTTNTPADHAHILGDSGATGALVSSRALAERLLPALDESDACRWAVAMDPAAFEGATPRDGLRLADWQETLDLGAAREDFEPVAAALDDTACFIYTSGTGGVPKGVMLTHRNIFANCLGAHHLLEGFGLGHEVFLSFLPLSHSYEHTAGQFFPISIGAQIYYAESADKLLENLSEARPTVMTAVPRLYESMHLKITRGIKKQGGLKRSLFEKALALGLKEAKEPGSLTLIERLQNAVLERLVRDKFRERFGGRLKGMVSGGAALNPDIGFYFTALGLPVLQGYGQTEASPVVSANPPGRAKMRTVGPPLRGVEVKIAEDGEILVRGELVMKGYWRNEEATAQVIKDGWLHTGDVGEIDEDGYITITDRKKDIIVMSGGDNVSPSRIEGLITLEPEIAQAMVVGDKRPHLVALLVPDAEYLQGWAKSNGKAKELSALAGDEALRAELSQVLDRVNTRLSTIERVRRYVIADDAFTVENEMMTPTLKIRRHKIKAVYGERLEALYR